MTAPRQTSRNIKRHKASNYQNQADSGSTLAP